LLSLDVPEELNIKRLQILIEEMEEFVSNSKDSILMKKILEYVLNLL